MDLNTSHVNVNPNLASANLASADNLNTSHVNVNLTVDNNGLLTYVKI